MNQLRDRTMVANRTSHFLVINRKMYFQSFPINQNLNQETSEQLQLFYDYFQASTKEQKEEIKIFQSLFGMKKFQQNDIVYKTDDESQHLYFIITGSVRRQEILQTLLNQNISQLIYFKDLKQKNNQQINKCVRLCDYTQGQFFGEIEFFQKTKRLFSVIVNKACLTYYCSYQAFAEIQQITKKTCNVIKLQHQLKYESFQKRIEIIKNNEILKNFSKHGHFDDKKQDLIQIKQDDNMDKTNLTKNNEIFQNLVVKTCNTFFDSSQREKPMIQEYSHQLSNKAKNSIFLDQVFYDRTAITNFKIQKKKSSLSSRSLSPITNKKKEVKYSFPFKVINHTTQNNQQKIDILNTVDNIFEKRQKVNQFITQSRQKNKSPYLITAQNNIIKYKEIPIKILLNVNIDLFDAENQPRKQYLIRLQNVKKLHEKKTKILKKL